MFRNRENYAGQNKPFFRNRFLKTKNKKYIFRQYFAYLNYQVTNKVRAVFITHKHSK